MNKKVANLGRGLAQKGYSILEVMLTLVVVGVGILAIVQLQSSLSVQVGDNKAKAEATSIAEARIEALRNYTNKVADLDEFKSVLLATSGTSQSVPGVNADFVRQEVITDGGDTVEVTLNVTWDDRTGTSRNVSVTSEIAYVSPAAAGQKGIDNSGGDFSLPTGGAKPGEGKITDITTNQVDDPNGDRTSVTDDGENVYLFDEATNDILLVLENACETQDGNVTCDDFTRIHGRVYIDKTSFINKNVEPVSVGAVDVVASNSAYCSRFLMKDASGLRKEPIVYHYDVKFDKFKPTIPSDNQIVQVVNDQDDSMSTTDYDYFDYICYVGRGWYGNVGVYVYFDPDKYGGETTASSLGRQAQSCMGDPGAEGYPDLLFGVADQDDGSDTNHQEKYDNFKREYALSRFRAYRGMIYDQDGKNFSIGVAGNRDLGLEPGCITGCKPMHNFVISLISASATVDDCLEVSNKPGALLRDDAVNELLFTGVPDDFVCLNTADSFYLDDYDKLTYSAEYCSLDPTTIVTP